MFRPSKHISPEQEEKMLDMLAREIVKRGLETPAIVFLESFKPLAVIGTQLTGVVAWPLLELLGDSGYDYLTIFSERKNIELLMKKIEELLEGKEKHATS